MNIHIHSFDFFDYTFLFKRKHKVLQFGLLSIQWMFVFILSPLHMSTLFTRLII